MGQKVHPHGFRLGYIYDWKSKWYADKTYKEQLHEDLAIREADQVRLSNTRGDLAAIRATYARLLARQCQFNEGLVDFNAIYSQQPHLIQATSLLALTLPVLIFFFAQRFFIEGIQLTGHHEIMLPLLWTAVEEALRLAMVEPDPDDHKDVIVDICCYRRLGHNEADEPAFTQPRMYEVVRSLPTVREQWASKLVSQGVVDQAEADAMLQTVLDELSHVQNRLQDSDSAPITAAPEIRPRRPPVSWCGCPVPPPEPLPSSCVAGRTRSLPGC